MATYALADLHGVMDLYLQVKAFLKPEDTVYFLGDAGDRGPQPYETIKAILNDSQFIYLKGNHDDMLEKAYRNWKKYGEGYDPYIYDLYKNGGVLTFEQMAKDPEADKVYLQLKELPASVMYNNVHLSHAGFTPWTTNNSTDYRDLIWDRSHITIDWIDGEMSPDIISVHGHTPIPFVMKERGENADSFRPGAYWYCNNHKVCIDNGSAWSGYTCLLDLDTFDEHIFFSNLKEYST